MFFDDKIENKIALLINHFAINATTEQGCVININPYYINSIDSYNYNLTQSNSYVEKKLRNQNFIVLLQYLMIDQYVPYAFRMYV